MARYKDEHWSETHEAIVDAAARLLRMKGFDGLGVAEAMRAVGLTHGGFYAHFSDKTDLLVQATQRAFEQSPKDFEMLANMAAAAKQGEQMGDAGVVAAYYLSDSQLANVQSGCPGAALASDVARQAPAVREAFSQGGQAIAKALGKTAGLASQEQPHAWAALALLMGSLTLMRALPDGAVGAQIRDQAIAALRTLASQGGQAKAGKVQHQPGARKANTASGKRVKKVAAKAA